MKSVWSDETGRIINKVNKISCCLPLTSLCLKTKGFKKKLLPYWPSFASISSCSATRRSVDLAFVAFESILHVLPWSDRCLLCLASRNRRAPALPNHWLLLVFNIFPRISLHCKLIVPVQYWEYEYGLFIAGEQERDRRLILISVVSGTFLKRTAL